jgi:ubiquitin-conjugating enzyme E2 O
MPPLNALNAPSGLDPLLRPLNRGEVGVSFFPDNRREIRQETDFTLVDRFFQPGDVCKRSIHDAQSGVVASVDVQFQVAHVISNKHIDEWKSIKDIQKFPDVSVGDYVACDDWIGQVSSTTFG